MLLDSLIPYEVNATRAAIEFVVTHLASLPKSEAIAQYIPALMGSPDA